jgi:hypothetical protein
VPDPDGVLGVVVVASEGMRGVGCAAATELVLV